MKKVLSLVFAALMIFSAFQMTVSAASKVINVTVPEPVVGNKVYTSDVTVSPDEYGKPMIVYYKRASGTADNFEPVARYYENGKERNPKFEEGYDYKVEVTFSVLSVDGEVKINGHKTKKVDDLHETYSYVFGTEDEPEKESFFEKITAPFKRFIELIKALLSIVVLSV